MKLGNVKLRSLLAAAGSSPSDWCRSRGNGSMLRSGFPGGFGGEAGVKETLCHRMILAR